MKNLTIGYPQMVEEYANDLVNHPATQEICNEMCINEKCLFEEVCAKSFEKFVSGTDIILSDVEMEKCVNTAFVSTQLYALEEEGFVLNIADDDKMPRYVLTEKGKLQLEKGFEG